MPVQKSYPKILINMLLCVVRIFMNQTLDDEMKIKTWFEMKQPLLSLFLTLLEHGVPPSLLSFVADPSCSGYAAL